MRIQILLAALFYLVGCSSMPTRDIPEERANPEILQLRSVSIDGCEEYKLDSDYEIGCNEKMEQLSAMLESTELFSKVEIQNDETEYVIKLKPYSRYPYYLSIGHNPGVLLLSSVIPFWESYEYGYDFSISRRAESNEYRVNTLERGTHLMWSVSMLINILPSRGVPGTFYENEIKHLRNTIINTLM